MVSVLSFIGYGPTESLQFFLTRFTFKDKDVELVNGLEKVWICHKNVQKLSELQKTLNSDCFDCENYKNHSLTFKSLTFPIEEQYYDKFKSSVIIQEIINKLHCCLADYLLTECLLLYNWGLNSLELIIDNEEVTRKILTYEAACKRKRVFVDDNKDFRKWRYLLTNQSEKVGKRKKKFIDNDGDLFEEEERKAKRRCSRLKTPCFSELRKIYEECDKPFQELVKDTHDPSQEMFSKDKILYDLNQRCWPGNHALSVSSPDEFMKRILNVEIQDKTNDLNESQGWTQLRHIFNIILENHKKVVKYNGYGRILKRHLKDSGFETSRASEILKPVPTTVVSSYIADVLRKVVPLKFFGSNRIRKKFFREITKIINGEKNENFIFHPITQMFLNVKRSLPWLDEIQGWSVARRIILKISKWLLLDYILLILKNLFYITDVGSSGYRLYYYKKNDMERAVSLWVNSQILKKNISLVKGNLDHWNSVERKWLETGFVEVKENECSIKMPENTEYIYPAARVRFLPKIETDGDFRMITSYAIKKTVLPKSKYYEKKLVDMFMERHVRRLLVLRKVKFLLEYLVEKYGTGIKPLPNNPKLELAWMRALHLKKIYGKLYFVKADITDAYGSVLPGLLGSIIDEKLKVKSNHTMQIKKIKECRVKNGGIECSIRKTFTDKPKENCLLISRSVFLNSQKKLPSYDSKKLKNILDQIIYNQYLHINGKHYRLVKGFTQGSAGLFSPLLCEIYYSEMDRLCFADFMTCSECILLRGVDDYLLITSNIEKASKFYGIVYNGVKDFNASFNGSKLKSNINEDISCVHYLGLIFDVKNMSVKPDYSKYQSKDILSTVKLCDSFGGKFFRKTRFLRNKALRMEYLKLLPITLNNTFNNLSVMREIVYGASFIESCKVLVLTRHLFRVDEKNDLDICVILSKSLSKMTTLILRFNKDITKDEITFLFWHAALSAFRKYSGIFSNLLVVIRYRLFVVKNRSKNDGKEAVLNLVIKDLKSKECWSDLRRTLRIITRMTKPSNRLK